MDFAVRLEYSAPKFYEILQLAHDAINYMEFLGQSCGKFHKFKWEPYGKIR